MEQYKHLPVQAPVLAGELGFEGAKDSVVECGHLRSIDRDARIIRKRGKLSENAMGKVDRALAVSLGL
jgi:mRNA interferase MazF